MPGFGYIHRLKVKEHYPGVPSDVAKNVEPSYRRRGPGHKLNFRTRNYQN